MENNVRTIKSLSLKQICFVKRLYLENSFFGGVACYTRPLSDEYKMRIKERSEVELHLYQYGEDEYPKDALDEAIIKAFQKDYPNLICKTSLQFFDSELEDNMRWKNQRECIVSEIRLDEIVTADNIPYADPVTYPINSFPFKIEIYFLKSAEFNRVKAELLRIYSCTTAEYHTLLPLINNTYSVFSNIK